MKLHVGCGNRYLEGYKHLDIRELEDGHIDYVTTANDLSQFADNTIEELYACHLLEHFGRHETKSVLQEWYRVLKPSGNLRIAVPDFEAIIEVYKKTGDLTKLIGLLYGGQNYEFNFHHMTFDYSFLKSQLEEVGFKDVKRYDWKEFLPDDYDDYSRAYLPHMDFESGTLMSLNVLATK